MKRLNTLILQLENYIPAMDIENKNVSVANVAWHTQHSLLVINSILNTLKNADPNLYQWTFNFNKLLVFTLRYIPRGKGKAPKVVQPANEITKQLLLESVEKAKINMLAINDLHQSQYFLHPYFGHLNKEATIKFLAIHTKHHLKIINDILKQKR